MVRGFEEWPTVRGPVDTKGTRGIRSTPFARKCRPKTCVNALIFGHDVIYGAFILSALGQRWTFALQKVMSALPPKADMCSAAIDVCFGPIAGIGTLGNYSMTASVRASSVVGTVRPSAFAVVRLITRSNLVGCSTGRSPGFAPRRILSAYSPARRNRSGKFAP
jgi:hypothetical protein